MTNDRDSSHEVAPASRPQSRTRSDGAPSQWTFPKNSLEEAVRVAQALEEKYAGNPTPASELAKALGFNRVEDWRFLDLLRSANQYSLVSGTGAKARVSLTDIGSAVVAPASPDQRRNALREAFMAVDQFAKVTEFYKGKPLPDDEYFGNTLVREFDVPRDRVQHFIRVYVDNRNYLDSFKALVEQVVQQSQDLSAPQGNIGRSVSEPREFLDTCFVLMPFGEWFDRYFREIYAPAIRDAGLEPIRADGIFTSGTVIEQIWEQISKAKVLLAELSGKNANVFYELGLAHALGKPVIIVSCDLEDVPFDLRHLRVVTYDVRSPTWADDLKRDVVAYLRSARSDPEKSIPQPFRSMVDATDQAGTGVDQ